MRGLCTDCVCVKSDLLSENVQNIEIFFFLADFEYLLRVSVSDKDVQRGHCVDVVRSNDRFRVCTYITDVPCLSLNVTSHIVQTSMSLIDVHTECTFTVSFD